MGGGERVGVAAKHGDGEGGEALEVGAVRVDGADLVDHRLERD